MIEIKKIYKNFIYEFNGEDDNLVDNLARILKFKFNINIPLSPLKVIVIGLDDVTSNNYTQSISKKYGFINICYNSVISDEIRRKSEIGKLLYYKLQQKEDIDDQIISDLLEKRVSKTDAKISGYILKYVATASTQKIESLLNSKINFDFIISLNNNNNNFKNINDYLKNKYPSKIIDINPDDELASNLNKINFSFENYIKNN